MSQPRPYDFPDLLTGVPLLPKALRQLSPSQQNGPHDIAVRAYANGTYKERKIPLSERAERYMAENPEVYRKFCSFVWQLVAVGKEKVGAKMIAERMRWESMVSGNDGFKVNNSYISAMARRFMRENPQVGEIFETREKTA